MEVNITFGAFVAFMALLASWLSMPQDADVQPEGGIGQRRG